MNMENSDSRNYFVYMYVFPNGKRYIGQSHDGVRRYGGPQSYRGMLVHRAMAKYKWFNKWILWRGSEDDVDSKEMEFIKMYDSCNRDKGYNIDLGGNSNKNFSEEHRKHLSEAHIGMHNPHSDEWKKHISEGLKGHAISDESKKKMSNAKIGSVPVNRRSVICVETKKIYFSVDEAEKDTGASNITEAIKGTVQKRSGGYH